MTNKRGITVQKSGNRYDPPTEEMQRAYEARAAAEDRRERLRLEREQADPWDDVNREN